MSGGRVGHGPFAAVDAESFLGSRSTVQVAGVPGLLLDSPDLGFQRWVWTADERTWVMEAQELTTDEVELVAAGVITTGADFDWQPTGEDLDLQVVARRPGPPPTYRSAHLEWYVDLTGPDGRAAYYYVSYQPEHPTLALEAAHPGVVVSADGTEARIDRPGLAEGAQISLWRAGLTISAGSGPVFVNDTDPLAESTSPDACVTQITVTLVGGLPHMGWRPPCASPALGFGV